MPERIYVVKKENGFTVVGEFGDANTPRQGDRCRGVGSEEARRSSSGDVQGAQEAPGKKGGVGCPCPRRNPLVGGLGRTIALW